MTTALQQILIVDDDAANCELLRDLLTAEGYTVDVTHSGRGALEKIEARAPDLVLLDVMMPEENGFVVCRKIKERFTQQYVPVILLTVLEDPASVEQGFNVGADDFVSKPFERRVLMARVRSVLRAKALWDELIETQQKLIESEALAAVGQMIVTLKHEINNPLQTIIGYADYLLSSTDPSHEFYEQLDAICKAGERISELLAKLDHVRRVATAPYLGEGRMVDVDRSTQPQLPRQS